MASTAELTKEITALTVDRKSVTLYSTAQTKQMTVLTYRQLQEIVKSNRKSPKEIRANASADVLIEWLKEKNLLPQEYQHQSKAASRKSSSTSAPSKTRKPAKNANGTTKKPVGGVAPAKPGQYSKKNDKPIKPATPHAKNKKFNEPTEEMICKASENLQLQEVAVQAKLASHVDFSSIAARRAAFKAQTRNEAWY